MDNINHWIWPALALAFLLGGIATRWLYRRFSLGRKDKVNQEYFKGLNFLLNEETDKAIEVFIKALEVDSETVELHLALGGLFRRKGQVDRATRIHQNLIARPSLSEEQRMQAVHELAQDYYKAGWLDRAENLFLELKESDSYRALALNGLCRIYQQEKEWQQAIDVLKLHKRADRPHYQKQMAHYHCELAEMAILNEAFDRARKHLRFADAEDATAARVSLLRGEVNFAEGNYKRAIECWKKLIINHPKLAQLVVINMILAYQKIGDQKGLRVYLNDLSLLPKEEKAFRFWLSAASELLGEDAVIERVFEQVQCHGLTSPVANYLQESIDEHKLSLKFRDGLLSDLLDRAKKHNIEYTCGRCGFDTKAMYWFCQNCGEWESFR